VTSSSLVNAGPPAYAGRSNRRQETLGVERTMRPRESQAGTRFEERHQRVAAHSNSAQALRDDVLRGR